MLGKTHIAGGILASLILCNSITSGILLSFGSILPDIDHHNSFLGKHIPLIPKLFKHRGFTHSLLFAVLIWFFVSQWIAYGILVHILFDLFTRNGVQLFYPNKNNIRLPLAKLVSTGGTFECCLLYSTYIFILLILTNNFIYRFF